MIRLRTNLAVPLLAVGLLLPTRAGAAAQALIFQNGDLLLGQLEAITPAGGLKWKHPDASASLAFAPSAIAEVHLGNQSAPLPGGSNLCHVQLTNGDELSGRLVALDASRLVLATWYAGEVTIPRRRLASLRPVGTAARVLFEGPDGTNGWTMGKVHANPGVEPGHWHFDNGRFVATQSASIARDVKLPPQSSVEFDLAWRGTFALAVAVYTDSLQPIRLAEVANEPEFGGFYSLQINNYSASLLHVSKQNGTRQIGLAVIPVLQQTNQARFALKSSREQAQLVLLVNDVPVKQWVDSAGFSGEGTGIRMVHQGQGPVRLGNLRVTEWDGRIEDAAPVVAVDPQLDAARLINRDVVTGALETIREGAAVFRRTGQPELEVPLARVAQVDFAPARAKATPWQLGDVRLFFTARGSVTFTLESWTADGVLGRSASLGPVKFSPRAFSRIQFQPAP